MTDIHKVSQAPTRPSTSGRKKEFDVADLYTGPLDDGTAPPQKVSLDEKMRQAYFWIINHAIISPYYDIEYQNGATTSFTFGDQQSALVLPSEQSYSSFVLLPILTLAVRRRCLFVGGPGRGKTASAILMGVLAGYSLKEIRRGIQHGQPELTVTDLLGNPLPKDLVGADHMDDIRIAWRKWLSLRVKIVDEYNRIPTRTQSALLTLMGDNYAEVLDQVFECPESAWYLTANDDSGGGTYQVIEALRDRIDVVVKALHFSPRFLGDLLSRIEAGIRPEEMVPKEVIFNEEELDRVGEEILTIKIPEGLLKRIEFFASQFEFIDLAADQFEYKTKDTVKLSGQDVGQLLSQDSGRDALKDIGVQTQNGLSVRALMTVLVYIKAVAWFRGNESVQMEDIRQVLPFVLHDKLVPNANAVFFDQPRQGIYRIDRIGWIRKLFDLSCTEYDRLDRDRDDPVEQLSSEFKGGLEGISEKEIRRRLVEIEKLLRTWSQTRKMYGHLFDDILKLKYLHQRYTNYLKWLEWNQT